MASLTSPRRTLNRLLGVLAADENVAAVYAGGSVSRNEDDEVSDLDLCIEGDTWSPESIGSLLLTADQMQMGGSPFLHSVFEDGTILDVRYRATAWPGYVRLELGEPTPVEPAPLPPYGLQESFWFMSLKHRKSIWRGQYGIVVLGLQHDRMHLLRAWALLESGEDPGPSGFSIFGLKALNDRHIDPRRLELLGLPVRNAEEIVYAAEAYRDEMSRLFPETSPLETAVRSLPLLPSK